MSIRNELEDIQTGGARSFVVASPVVCSIVAVSRLFVELFSVLVAVVLILVSNSIILCRQKDATWSEQQCLQLRWVIFVFPFHSFSFMEV